jgi:TonB-dependent SusC/RagA subfamily outer membrane receptor
MPYIAQYLLKLSISFAVVYLFYVLVLRRLTFYSLNRWYLLVYSLLSFFIPFVDISPVLEQRAWTGNAVVQLIPAMGNYAADDASGKINGWVVSLFLLLVGIIILLIRLLVQYISFLRIRRSAQLISDDAVKIYQVDQYIMPFSFGRSIFINQHQHKEEELKEIIRHEFIHVKQRHTADILFGEILSMLNWYNPFTWLIRHAIRQNLEFIADHQVLKTGLDRKQYQYLLLKVVGTPAFAIANQFSFSSLKKRIAMMNKMRSAKVHLIKFLFVLPLITVLLLAFRQAAHKEELAGQGEEVFLQPLSIPADIVYLNQVQKQKVATDTTPVAGKIVGVAITKKDTAKITIDASLNGPGSPYTLRLRGTAMGTEPMIVIDGKPLENGGLQTVNPNTIESITILKDTSAVAIYGPLAKDGVILITTKKGFKAQPPAPVVHDTVSRPVTRITINSGQSGMGLQSFPGLIIIDDVQYDSLTIRNIELNPDNIISVNVYKDKSAEALYGSRGAQGVIVIKTQKKDPRITGTFKAHVSYTVSKEESEKLYEEARKNHILYVGVENHLPVVFKNVKPEELLVKMSGVRVNYQDGVAIIKPAAPGKAELIISRRKTDGSEAVLQKQVYDIKFLPPPSGFASYRGYTAPPVQVEGKPFIIDASERVTLEPEKR